MSGGGPRERRRELLAGLLALVAVAVPLPVQARGIGAARQAPADTGPEPILVELQVGRLASRTVQAFRVRTEALVPLTHLFELAEIRAQLSPEGRLEARVDPGGRRLVIDILRDTMMFGTRRVRIEPDFRLFRDGELYVGAERLGDLLGARVVVGWTDLVVTLVDPADLPVGRRARREATREAFLRRAARSRPELELVAERPAWDGLVFDYSVFSPSSEPLAGASYGAAVGADALGGSLELGVSSVGPAQDGVARLDGSWTGVWRDSRWLKQLRIGDGPATGPRARRLRGVSMTNSPFLRPSHVGDISYAGRLEAGWSVEAYRGGDLVAYDSTDAVGGFAVDLPVRYGENPVDFVAYGPFGEIREFNRTYRVIAELLPARRFEYGLSAGSCVTPLCGATANLDLRYGAARGWTVRAGAEQFWRDSLADRFHPYAALVATPTNAWAVEVEAVGDALARGGVRYEPSLHLRLAADAARYASDTAPVAFVAGRRWEWSVTAFWRPVPRAGFAFLDARLEHGRTTLGTDTRARLGGSLQAGAVRWFPYVRLERAAGAAVTAEFAGVDVFVLPRAALGPLLGAVWVRAGTETDGSGFTRASAFVARHLGAGLRLEVGTIWSRGAPGPTSTLVVTTYLRALRSATALTLPPGAPALATQYVQGSVLWDRATGGVTVAPGPSLERAGVAGHVFMDDNGNGVRDPGEVGVPAVRVRVGSSSALSDASGLYRVWDVVPHEPIVVTVDSLSLESPLVVPAFGSASLVPGPNRFRIFDIPIVRGGVLEGRVTRAGRGVGGVTLLLTDRRTGARRVFATFSDGEFYAFGVRPGDYELTVDPRVLDVLGSAAAPVRFTLAPTAEGVGRSGLEVELTPRP